MKKLTIILVILLWTSTIRVLATAVAATAVVAPDTIILRLDNGQDVQIISQDNNEVEVLNNYDLNAIIDDLRESMDSLNSEGEAIMLEDRAGERYFGKRNDTEDSSLVRKVEQLTDKLDQLSIYIKIPRDVEEKSDEKPTDRRKNYGTDNMLSLDLGLNNYLSNGRFPDENNALFAVKPVASWYVALGLLNRTHVGGPVFIDWGANVSWYNFKFQNERARLEKTDEGVRFFEDAPVAEPIKSKLVVPYLNVSLVPMLHLGRPGRQNWFVLDRDKGSGFRVGAGVYAGYRVGSRAKYVFREDDQRERVKERTNFYVNSWRYGVRFQLGIDAFDLFANYDLNELFVPGRGPELNAFSFGIVF